MANTTGLIVTEFAGSVGLLLAVLVEVGALLGNGALLVVVLRTPGLQDMLYLVHLCIVDLLAATSIMPLSLLAAPPPGLGRVRLGPVPCHAARFLSAALLPACTLGVAALGLARYHFIAHPLQPAGRPAPRLVLTAVWATAGLLGALSLLGPPPAPPPAPARCSVLVGGLGPFRPLWALLVFALPALLLLSTYGSIFLVARRAALRPPLPSRGVRLRSDSLDSRLSFLPTLRPRLPGGKAVLAPALAVGQFAACWLPYGCACLAPAARAAEAEATVTWVAYSAFAAHPFLYGLLQRPVRLALGRLTRRALPQVPQAWHPQALLQRLKGPPEGPALGSSEAPLQARELAGGLSLSLPETT
ncbi:G-protein coupled receptor 62 [Fukomys damarensis]|uniref:Putative G-protein coupled receptor 62 n=1 Tax=Fukomys damarensis TaxID=885580 RepID=A0A091DNM2_FUKDA|nr:G-protein coupled receptor 62 [Fukomys damarensis]KFO32682.1 Putative G-protein coupled receptor 62 [Fukomys damarensis]